MMAEYERGEAWMIKAGEPIEFTNHCKSALAVGTGIIFREDGQYIVSVKDNRIMVDQFYGRPVVRGTWVKANGAYMTPGGDPVWQCSRCGKGTHVYGVEHGSYGADVADKQWVSCPNCGAIMEEVM